MAGTVVRISIAPVKSLHLVHPDEVELTHAGVVGDRRFWLVDADGRLANGKRFPQLMQIRPEWDEATRRLAFDAARRRAASRASSSRASRSRPTLYGDSASVAPRRRAVAGRDLRARRRAADAALVGRRRGRPRRRSRRLGVDHLPRLARTAAAQRPARRPPDGAPVPDALRDRRRRRARGGRVDRRAAFGSATPWSRRSATSAAAS